MDFPWLHPQFRCNIKYVDLFEECSICLESVSPSMSVVMFSCGHRFCKACATSLVDCALCRHPISTSRVTLHVGDWNVLHTRDFHDEIWIEVDVADEKEGKVDILIVWRFLWNHFGRTNVIFDQWFISAFADWRDPQPSSRSSLLYTKWIQVGDHLIASRVSIRGETRAKFIASRGPEIINSILCSNGSVRLSQLKELFLKRWQVSSDEVNHLLKSESVNGTIIGNLLCKQ